MTIQTSGCPSWGCPCWVVCMMVSFFWDTCCGCLVARSWDIFLCILSSSYASTLWIGKIPWAGCFWGLVSLLPASTILTLRNVSVCNPGPRSKQKSHTISNPMTSSMKKSVELRLQFLTGLIYKGAIRDKDWTLSMLREDFVLWLRLRASCSGRLRAFLVAGWGRSLWIRLKFSTLLLWFNPNTSQLCFVYIFFFFAFLSFLDPRVWYRFASLWMLVL